MKEKHIKFILLLSLLLNLCIVSCSVNSERKVDCIYKPLNSTCINHDTYFHYTDNVEYLLQLEYEAVNYIEANVTNQYCRNYLKVALCATIYPPCNSGVQQLCSEECDALLNSGICASDTIYLIEHINMLNYFENFTMNCSNSLTFLGNFLSTTPCKSSKCISLSTIADTPLSCISFQQLDPVFQLYSQLSLSLNGIIYKYTSKNNFSTYVQALKLGIQYLPQLTSLSGCQRYAGLFVYNTIFIPCNLTTGSPRPFCSSDCYYFRDYCEYEYSTIISYANLVKIPFSDDFCDNTLEHINKLYNYPNLSKDFENDCFRFSDSLRTNGSVTSNNTSICNLTSSNDDINDSVVTSTINVTMTSTTTNHPISSSTPISSNTPYDNFNTTSTTNSSNHLSSKPVISYPVIASCLAGGLLGLCFIMCIVGFLVKRKLHKTNSTSPVNLLFKRIDIDVKKEFTQADKTAFTGCDMELLKKECKDLDELIIPACEVELLIVLGEGEFGKVYKGTWQYKTDNGDTESKVVAIKTIKNFITAENIKSILCESILMKGFDHPNVLNVLGVGFNMDSGLPFVVLPFMVNGDLKTYLKKKRQNTAAVDCLPEEIGQNTLFDMCCQIAHGMNYLAAKKIVHRDLAARNCMVGDSLNIKVADFGLARDVYIKEYYRQQSIGKIPVRWMAPEALHDKISNEKTDVWSYGITCWEIFSLGRTPYPAIPNHEILKFIDKGNRPLKPNLCTDTM